MSDLFHAIYEINRVIKFDEQKCFSVGVSPKRIGELRRMRQSFCVATSLNVASAAMSSRGSRRMSTVRKNRQGSTTTHQVTKVIDNPSL
jgi:hypothetical protein